MYPHILVLNPHIHYKDCVDPRWHPMVTDTQKTVIGCYHEGLQDCHRIYVITGKMLKTVTEFGWSVTNLIIMDMLLTRLQTAYGDEIEGHRFWFHVSTAHSACWGVFWHGIVWQVSLMTWQMMMSPFFEFFYGLSSFSIVGPGPFGPSFIRSIFYLASCNIDGPGPFGPSFMRSIF
jgi:hypothetical protein